MYHLDFEMQAATMMIEKTKYLLEQEELKKQEQKTKMKGIMDQLYQEGQELILKKQREKEREWDETKKIQRDAAIKVRDYSTAVVLIHSTFSYIII